MELAPEEMRVLACLAEKQLTTPAQYPLTLNALTLACNQTTSREPVVTWDEQTVEAAVTRAKTMGLARFIHPSHGRSALRYGHALDEVLGLDVRQLALMTVLMLRGPQTLAELRTRTQRMAEFADTGEVESDLDGLARYEPPLVKRLGRQPGQKEERYAQLLGRPGSAAAAPAASSDAGAPDVHAQAPAPTHAYSDTDRRADPGPVAGADGPASPSGSTGGAVATLQAEVAELRAEVDSLRREVDDLRTQLGG